MTKLFQAIKAVKLGKKPLTPMELMAAKKAALQNKKG
jgi:hypothetical protein